jgi:glucose-6-phosphate 1-dehydrogenase
MSRRWQEQQELDENDAPYAPASWGPKEADELVAGHGRWRDPWIST